jgi:hypothetical protein
MAKKSLVLRFWKLSEMTLRQIIGLVPIEDQPPYVPWSFGFSKEAKEKLRCYFGAQDLEPVLQDQLVKLGSDISFFDDLIDIGLNCFNPFQPEVIDVHRYLMDYRERLTFHGGLSIQRTLPYGSVDRARQETARLLQAGSVGSYILTPAHEVDDNVPLSNMLAFIEMAQSQVQ